MINSGKDRITERYQQDNPEGARLVSDEKTGKAGKSAKSAKSGKTGKTAESAVKNSRGSNSPAEGAEGKTGGKGKKGAAEAKPKSAKKTEADAKKQPLHEETPTIKTPSVMKLIENAAFAENQVIAAGKSRIPRKLRGIEPLSRVIRREAEAESAAEAVQNSPMVRRNLTGMIIEAEAPEILKRFNACDCGRCCSELVRLTEAEMPARYVTIPELADIGYSGFSDNEKLLIESVKKTAVSVMIRLMIGNKRRNFHNE